MKQHTSVARIGDGSGLNPFRPDIASIVGETYASETHFFQIAAERLEAGSVVYDVKVWSRTPTIYQG